MRELLNYFIYLTCRAVFGSHHTMRGRPNTALLLVNGLILIAVLPCRALQAHALLDIGLVLPRRTWYLVRASPGAPVAG